MRVHSSKSCRKALNGRGENSSPDETDNLRDWSREAVYKSLTYIVLSDGDVCYVKKKRDCSFKQCEEGLIPFIFEVGKGERNLGKWERKPPGRETKSTKALRQTLSCSMNPL
jgi:hypothetical protein